jgi:acyl-CoA synthetase (AMP-forming)/AMP-acid ligase II
MRVETVRGAMAVDGLGTTLDRIKDIIIRGGENVSSVEVVQQVLAHCREQLADFKIPQYIVVSGGPLPRNPGGKLLNAQWRKSVEWGAPL